MLRTGAALPFAFSPLVSRAATTPAWLLLGTDKGKGLYRASWDARTGAIGRPELALEAARPSFFADHPRLSILYSADEGTGADSAISAVWYDPVTGATRLRNRVPAGAPGSCYVSVSQGGDRVFSANYAGGAFFANRIGADGALSTGAEASQLFLAPALPHPGPVADRQDKPHPHCALVDEGQCLVCDLAGDRIFSFPVLKGGTGALFGNPQMTATRPGAGPRHIAVLGGNHARRLYLVVHELDCTVEVFERRMGGKLARVDGTAVPTLPEGTPVAGSTASEIVVAPGGPAGTTFVYTATRLANVLTVFAVDGLKLRAIQHLPCGGDQPRWIGLDPSGRWLLCCNQAGNSVAVFARDEKTGKLTAVGAPAAAESPMCAQFLVAKA